MSDNTNKLKAVLLSEATTEQQKEFAKILAEQCAQADLRAKGHKCWLFIPTEKEWESMKKYSKDDKCPKCGKGRIVLEIFKDNICQGLWLKCHFSKNGCDYKESITDLDNI